MGDFIIASGGRGRGRGRDGGGRPWYESEFDDMNNASTGRGSPFGRGRGTGRGTDGVLASWRFNAMYQDPNLPMDEQLALLSSQDARAADAGNLGKRLADDSVADKVDKDTMVVDDPL